MNIFQGFCMYKNKEKLSIDAKQLPEEIYNWQPILWIVKDIRIENKLLCVQEVVTHFI